MTKRILALLLALTMVFSVLTTGYALDSGSAPEAKPAAADAPADHAEPSDPEPPASPAAIRPGDPVRTVYEGTCGDALSWSLDAATGVLTVTGTGDMYDYDTTDNLSPWYELRNEITALVFSEGITSIGNYAFQGCSALDTVTLPEGLSSVGRYAFLDCASMASLTLPESLTSIGDEAFMNCSALSSVVIPKNVTTIGGSAFWNCSSLTRAKFMGPCPTISSPAVLFSNVSGFMILYRKGYKAGFDYNDDGKWDLAASYRVEAWDADLQICGDELAWSFDEDSGTLTITGTGDMYDYTINVATGAPWTALRESITAVSLPEGMSSVGAFAFYRCTNLTQIELPDSLRKIGNFAFRESGLTNVLIPANVSEIGKNPFTGLQGMTEFNLDPANAALQTTDGMLLSADGKTLYCVAPCRSGKLNVPAGVNTICDYAMFKCSQLTSVVLPTSLQYLNDSAIYMCEALIEVTVSSTLRKLGSYAIADNAQLTKIFFRAGCPISFNVSYSLVDNKSGMIIYYTSGFSSSWNGYPTFCGYTTQMLTTGSCGSNLYYSLNNSTGVLDIYPGDSGPTGTMSWSGSAPWYSNRSKITSVVIEAGTLNVYKDAFYSYANLTGVTLPEGLEEIGMEAFASCTKLTGIVIPSTVSTVGSYAFSGCSQLASATLPASLQTVPDYMFRNCTILNTVEIPEGVSAIGPYAFYGCTSLSALCLPESLSSIGNYAFYNCSGLLSVSMPQELSSLGQNAFYGCKSLNAIVIPEGVQTVGSSAFSGCSALSSVVFPSTLRTLSASAFYNCSSLTKVDLPEGLTTVNGYVFQNCSNLHFARFRGTPPTSFGSGVFSNCASDFVIYYPSNYRSQWSPNGETTWKNYPIQVWLDPIEGECGTDVTFYFDPDSKTLTISGFGAMDDLASPDDQPWAEVRAWIEHVVVEDGVTAVGDYVFAELLNLEDLSLGAGLTRIGDFAFLGDAALTELTLPAAVNAVSGSAFVRCSALDAFTVADGNTTYTAVDGVLFNADGTELICWPAGKGESDYEIPDGVLRVGDYAFAGAGDLQFVQFPETLSAVGSYALCECDDLNSVLFPAGSVSLGDSAFAGCSALELVGFPGVLPTVLGENVFADCGEKLLFLAAVDHEFGWYAPDVTEWQGHPIIGLRLDETILGRCGDALVWGFDESTGLLTVTGLGAMYEQSEYDSGVYPWMGDWIEDPDQITAVLLREGVTAIPDDAFCMLENLSAISLPATLEEIGVGAIHANPNLQTLTLAAGSQSFTLSGGALYSADGQTLVLCLPTKTGTVTVPTGVRVIRERAFASCAAMTELVLPDGLERIEDYAFYGCAALTKITPLGAPPTESVGENIFTDCHEDLAVWITEDQEPLWDEDGEGKWQGVPLHVVAPELPLNPGAGEHLSWSFDSAKGILHISGTGPMYDFTDTNPPWYVHKDAIREVWIEEGVTTIGAKAFYKYPNLHTIRMSDTLTSIGFKACYGDTEIKALIFPVSLKEIGEYAFANLLWYKLSTSEVWGRAVFEGPPPDSIAKTAFAKTDRKASNMSSYSFAYFTPYYEAEWAAVQYSDFGFDADRIHGQLGEHVYLFWKSKYGDSCWISGYGDLTDYSYLNLGASTQFTKGITGFGKFCFTDVSHYSDEINSIISSFAVPVGIERIGDFAFYDFSELESVSIPSTVTEIGQAAFAKTPELSTITVNDNNPAFKVVDGVLYSKDGTRLLRCTVNKTGTFTIPDGVVTVDAGAFASTGITELNIPASVTYFGDATDIYYEEASYDVQRGNLSRITAYHVNPDNQSFSDVGGILYNKNRSTLLICPPGRTASVTLPETLTAIGPFAFFGCSGLTAVYGVEQLASLPHYAFACSGISSMTLPANITEIPEGLFCECENLRKLTIPSGVSQIGDAAFAQSGITALFFQGTAPELVGETAFDDSYPVVYINPNYILNWAPNGEKYWNGLRLELVGGDNCGEDVHWYYDYGTLTIFGEGDMEDFATHAGVPWYEHADQITKVVVGEGVTGVGAYAFAGLTKLTTAELPETLTKLGAYAFAGDAALESVTLPEGLETVGIRAFFQSGLRSITVPASVTSLGESAFQYCPALKTATFTGAAPAQAGPAIFGDCAPGFCILWPAEYGASWRPNGDETEWNGWPLALNVENQCGARMYWEFDSATATLTFYGGGEMYDYETASASRPPWYANYSSVQHVVLSEGITRVGNYAFYGFNKITDVSFPASLRELGTGAFWNCSKLNNVVLPANLETLGGYAFYNCQGLTALSFNSGLRSIGSSCFQNCYYLAGELVLPEDLETLGSYAFANCRSYTAISIPGSVKAIGSSAFANCYGFTELSLGEGVERIGRSAFNYCYGFTELNLPASLRELGTSCFQACSGITSVTIPAGVTTVSTHVFSNCTNLSTAVILAPWESIPDSFFDNCSKLEHLSFPETVTKLGVNTFGYCKLLTDFSLFSKVTEFGSQCFQGTGFASVTLPEGVTVIPTAAFAYNTDLVSVTFQGPVTAIGSEAFRGCTNLENFQLPDSLLTLGARAFYGCQKLRSVTIPEGVTTLNSSTFYNCYGLESVTLPNSLSLIDQNAFCYCTALTEVTFGYGLQTINYGAFNRCSLLASATFRGPAPTLGSSSGCFDYAASGFTIYYYAAYANSWSPNGETTWGVNYPISMLGSVEPGSAQCGDDLTWTWDAENKALTVTGSGPMYDYSPERPAPWACCAGAIQTVTLDEGVTSVGAYAFYACTALTTLNLHASLNTYGDYAFAWCVKLTSAAAPVAAHSVRHDDSSAPAAAHSVRHGGTGSLGTGAFIGCAALTSVTIPAGTAAIPANAFASCTKLNTVSIPDSVTAIGDAAFRGAGLRYVTIPVSVNNLGSSAFQGCASLSSVSFLGTPPEEAGEAVFHNCSGSFQISFEPLDYYTWTEGGTETTWEGYALNLADANRCGPQLYWSFNETTGVLRLTGSGEAYAYDAEHPYPWAGFTDQITEIAFGDAVTEIPAGAFAGCTALTRVTIPAGITKIGSRAFAGCTALTEADFWGEPPAEVGSEVFSGCAAGFRVCYLAELTDDWAPAGETAWHGWPLAELKHRVTFLNDDGTVIAELSVDRGTAPTPPAAPARTGWIFIGWDSGSFTFAPDAALSAAMSDKTYTAVYEKDLPDGFYLIRPDWVPEHIEAAERFTPNPNVEGEYLLNVTLTEGELITVARVEGRKITALYPEDFLPGYTVDADHAGSVTVCFRESFNEAWAEFGGYVFISQSVAPPVMPFTDVPDNAWYAPAVAWALENGITAGTSETTFSPNMTCTRAQIVTFLWRAAGSPVPTIEALSFTDVRQTAYYYDAVRWAVENGITNGVSETSFCPNRTCSRSEAVTFLWRASGSPVPTQTEMPFTDVPGDTWYTTPVLWAVENNITAGTSKTTYSPHQSCTRAQIVTFLWRASRTPE